MKLHGVGQLCLLAMASRSHAIQQFRHDKTFQPDHIPRVSEETMSIACTSKLVAVINGTTPGPAIHLAENKTSWVRFYNDFASDNLTMKAFSKPNPSSNETCTPEVIKVKPNQSYRMRTIGDVALSPLVFAVEDHDNLTVIAVDSRYTKPAETNIMQVGSGQRYDFILNTKTEDELQQLGKSLFWIQLETRYQHLLRSP
ncbi:L-ascorbate oxidase [Aspergillus affinis]|uniref:L-ascorbate oxidase n=1 Tax=Aspergillus affinis TaxID=1070780 RepID=UPI0022FE4722|nr:L-ascorbate oxidase [Aspergillus affinis]KAI9038588.1 L-ascorbate oxidase [Aspergillus affinis]